MKIIITGATGMVGSEVTRQALADSAFEQVTVIVRRPPGITSPKLNTIIHKDFMDYSSLADVWREHDACVWCLGISQNAVKEEEYIRITYDCAVAAGRDMLAANPGITMLFLSGEGAKSSEQSRLLFGRIKGKTENALLRMPFKKLYIARPAGILPVGYKGRITFALRMQYLLVWVFQFITPAYVIRSNDLAQALLGIIKHGADHTILTYRELKIMGRQ